MAAPLVSICIPAYEQVVYLERTLASILDQSFLDHETIITDDSTSGSVEALVDRYRQRFGDRLTYVRNRPAKGTPENWNTAVALAKGTYIKVMHHDEWFADAASLGQFVKTAKAEDAAFVFSSVITHVANSERSWELHPTDEEVAAIRKTPELIMLGNIIGPPSTTFYRRDLGISYDGRFKYVVDMAFYIQAFQRAGRVARIHAPLIHAVSDADHNVTNSCHVPEIELREYVLLFEDLEPRIPRSSLDHFYRFLFWLFVRYDIDSLQALRRFHPEPKYGTRYRVITWMVNAYKWRNRLFRRNISRTDP